MAHFGVYIVVFVVAAFVNCVVVIQVVNEAMWGEPGQS